MRDGHFAFLFYNNGHTDKVGYVGRLVVWLIIGKLNPDKVIIEWSQPEIAIWWDGILLDDREEWNEDWAIVDGAGYFDIQELENGNLAYVESNKLTVRYHEIPVEVINAMKRQIDNRNSANAEINNQLDGLVFKWIKDEYTSRNRVFRAPVLPDLRAGGGFTFVCWIRSEKLLEKQSNAKQVLVNGLKTVSGSLDEEDADDITKGFTIEKCNKEIKLFITDGFKVQFNFKIFDCNKNDNVDDLHDFYGITKNDLSMIAFVLDGGPKVASCIINDKYELSIDFAKKLPSLHFFFFSPLFLQDV